MGDDEQAHGVQSRRVARIQRQHGLSLARFNRPTLFIATRLHTTDAINLPRNSVPGRGRVDHIAFSELAKTLEQ